MLVTDLFHSSAELIFKKSFYCCKIISFVDSINFFLKDEIFAIHSFYFSNIESPPSIYFVLRAVSDALLPWASDYDVYVARQLCQINNSLAVNRDYRPKWKQASKAWNCIWTSCHPAQIVQAKNSFFCTLSFEIASYESCLHDF